MSASEVKDLEESLKSCKDYLDMERMRIETLQKEIKKLKVEILELKDRLKQTGENENV